MKYCYDCGEIIDKDQLSKEHIPAQCFYVGYGDEYKKNRITVDAHNACNHKYSKLDQELRDAIGIMTNDQTDKVTLISKSVKSILQKKDGKERISLDDEGIVVKFNYSDFQDLHVKNFKGIFCHEFKKPISEEYQIIAITDEDQDIFPIDMVKKLYHFADNKILKWSVSGHADIFKYKIAIVDSNHLNEPNVTIEKPIIFCVMVYHEEIMCCVIAMRQPYD